ncbi:hypothetical protein [Yoonia sp. 2307UL14-13]|uniref:hypothetical protein n=1 Tax=Yoonia sp. 2307UL14-13 TaxID=3126506 RepID=UPI0030959A56
MKLDQAYFDRVVALQNDAHLSALIKAVQAVPALADGTDDQRAAIADTVQQIWHDAEALDFEKPVSRQKYVLIYLTQAQWMKKPAHLAYAARMIGTPNQNWRIESGVLAVYANVVAAHYLAAPLIAFIKGEEKTG